MTAPGRYQAGTAFVPVVPSLRDFQKKVKSELGGMKIQATGEVKFDVNKANLAAAASAVDKMSDQVRAARGKEADAAGVVRAAEAKLQELWDSGKAKTAQFVAAEERLESARRKLAAATDIATKAQAGLDAAQKKAATAKTAADAPVMSDSAATAAGTRAGGKFAAALRKQVDGALEALPTPVINADSTPAEREIADLRRQLTALGDAKVGVDISAEQANARLDEIKGRLLALGSSSADIEVQVDSAAALAALGGVQQQVDQLDGDTAHVNVDADSTGAISGLNGVFAAGMKLGALVPVIAGVGAALAGIGGAAVVGVGALGVAALALKGIGGAYSALGDAEKSAGDDAAASAKQQASAAAAVTSATRSLANTRAQAADAQIRAEQRVAQAETSLVHAQREALRAQQALNDARREAQRALEDLAFQVEDGALAQRQAVLDLADAEQALAAVRSNPQATTRQQEEAAIAYEHAANQLERLKVDNQRLAVDKATADKAGVEGSERVVRAQDQVQDSTERVASAQQGLADAVREQSAQQRQAAYSIEQAQQALQQALAGTGDVGLASARKVRDAFAELSPVQAEFTTFLFSLRPLFDGLKTAAADGFLKPLQAGLQALVPVMPVIEKVVGQLASALGGLAQQALEALASPYWVEFFTLLGDTAGPVMQAFGQTLGQVAKLFGDLTKAFLPVAPIAADIIGTLAEGLRILAPSLGEIARVLTQGLLSGLQSLLPALEPLGQALAALAVPIGEVAGQLGKVLAAALIAIAPIITELAPPLTDLVTLVGSALLGAVEALAPVIAGLAPVLGDVAAILVGALGRALEKVLPYLDDIALVIGKALIGAVEALLPILPTLTEAWLSVLDAVLPLIPSLLQLAETLLPTLLDLIPVLTPVLTDIALAFAQIMPELVPIVTELTEGLLPVIEALAPTVVTMAEIFARNFDLLFMGIIVPLLKDVVIPAIGVLADILTWLWKYVAAPAFEGISAVVTFAWENVIRPAFDALRDGLDTVAKSFESATDFIRNSWNDLMEITAAPINFVIDMVYNKGIKAAWDNIAGLVGLDPLPKAEPIVFAGGGVLGGFAPGVDVVPALLSPGEAVLVPELVRALGPANILAANAAASGGRPATLAGFSGGGLATFAGGGLVDRVLGFLGGLGDEVAAMFRDPIGWIKAHIGVPDTPWVDMAAKLSDKAVNEAFDFLGEKLNPFTMQTSGKPGASMVASNAQLDAWIRAAMAFAGVDSSWYSGLLTLIMRESGGNPNAINLWDINAQNGVPSQGLMQTIPPTFAAYRDPRLPNQITDPIANIVAGINYIKARYGSIFSVQQANPSAPPMGYDDGGYLPPGLTAVYNGTGRPERVLTDEQWARLGNANSLEGLSLVGAVVEVGDDGLMRFVDGRIERANQTTGSAIARRTR